MPLNKVHFTVGMPIISGRGLGGAGAESVSPKPPSGNREMKTLIGVCCTMRMSMGANHDVGECGKIFASLRPSSGKALTVVHCRVRVPIVANCAVEECDVKIASPSPSSDHSEVRPLLAVCCMMKLPRVAN